MTWMYLIMVLIGIVIGIANIAVVRKYIPRFEKNTWGVSLILVALIYVAFLLRGGEGNWLWIEPAGVVFYGIFAVVGMTVSPATLGVGWLLHAFWDAGLHSGDAVEFVPSWYLGFCLGFDLAVGLYLFTRIRAWSEMDGSKILDADIDPAEELG